MFRIEKGKVDAKIIDKNCTIEAQLRRIDHLEMMLREKEKNIQSVSNVQAEHDWQTLKMEFEHQLRVFKEREILLMQKVHEQEKQLEKFKNHKDTCHSQTQTEQNEGQNLIPELIELENEVSSLQNDLLDQKYAFETEINKRNQTEIFSIYLNIVVHLDELL